MRIAIVGGTGKEGRGLGGRWARAGHEVFVGSRDGARAQVRAEELVAATGGVAHGGDNAWAVDQAEVVVLCVPFGAHAAALRDLAPHIGGRLVIDITVPLKPPRVDRVQLPECGAAALETRAILGEEAPIASTLHHVSNVHLEALDEPLDLDVLVCADDPDVRRRTMDLVADLGARPVDAGALDNAVALESFTPVLIHINKTYRSRGTGIRILGIDQCP